MATEDILIRYRADVSQLESDINKVIQSQEELTQATQQNTQAQNKAVTSAEFAAKKRAQLLEQEQQKLIKLRDAQKLAFDPTVIEKYNSQIAASQKRIELLGGSYQQAANNVQNSNQQILGGINRIAGAFGVAFTAEALVQFAQQAVTAFLDAQEQADKLRFAVTSIGGEGEEALARLTNQAQQLAEVTFFGDDDITAAQAALSAFGLTAQQIEEIIPKLADFAAVTGGTVTDAANTLGGALEGRAGEFKRFGIEVDAASTKAENLAKVSQGLAQQTGAAAAALDTVAGRAKNAKDQFGEFTELLGQGIVEYFTQLFNTYKEILTPLFESFEKIKNLLLNLIPDSVKQKLSELTNGFDLLKTYVEFASAPLRVFVNVLNFFYKKIIEGVPFIFGFVNVIRDGFGEIKDLASALGDGISNLFEGITQFDAGKLKTGLNKLKSGFQDIGFDVAKSFNSGFEKGQAAFKDTTKVIQEEQTKITENYLKGDELRKKSGKELLDLQKQYAKDQTNLGKQNLDEINKEIKRREELAKAGASAAEAAKKQAEEVAKLLQSLDAEIAKVSADLEKRKIEIIPANSQEAQIERIRALADLNEQAITDEIQGKIKLVQEDAKLSDKQKADIIAKYDELKAKRLELAQFNEQNELNIISKQQADRIEAAFAQIDALNLEQALVIEADKVEAANEAVAKSFEDLGKAVSKSDFEAAKGAAQARTESLNQALTEENNINKTRIENAREAELAKVKEGEAADEERAAINLKYDNQILNADKELNKQIATNNKNLNNTIDQQETESVQRRLELNKKIINETLALSNELQGIFENITNARLEQLQKQTDAELEQLEIRNEINKEQLDNRAISEQQFLEEQTRIENEKIALQEESAKREKELKQQQFAIQQATAIFEIGLSTATALGEINALLATYQAGLPATAALYANAQLSRILLLATSAAQVAAVLSQPKPYRLGSKDTGPQGHMARVGEEGEEFVYMPANSKVLPARQTRKYSDVIDAMYDNKLDNFIYKNYITPALVEQRKKFDTEKGKSFADNMAKSIYFNGGLNAVEMERIRKKGQSINNVEEIATAIARKLPMRDIYR